MINNNMKFFDTLDDPKIDTIIKAFEHNAYEYPHLDCLGTRDDS